MRRRLESAGKELSMGEGEKRMHSQWHKGKEKQDNHISGTRESCGVTKKKELGNRKGKLYLGQKVLRHGGGVSKR